MIEKKDIFNAVKHIVQHNASPKKVQIMHPTREWFVILAIATVGVFAAGIYSYIMYTWYDLRSAEMVMLETPTVPYRAPVVASALQDYRALEAAYSDRVSGLAAVAPALPLESDTDDVGTTTEAVTPSAEDASATTTEIAPGSIERQI